MEFFYNVVMGFWICFLIVWIAYLQTRLNITQGKLEDLEFLYDLRK